MDAIAIINKYYPEENELKHILLTHSRSVADKALWIADRHPELNLDRAFLEEAALLHDIGIFLTDADGIHCYRKHYPSESACSASRNGARLVGRTGGVLCRQVLLQNPSGQREECGKGLEEHLQIWGRWGGAFQRLVPPLSVNYHKNTLNSLQILHIWRRMLNFVPSK